MRTKSLSHIQIKSYLLALIFITAFSQNLLAQYSFKVEKQGTGKPIIFIPGLSSSGDVWQKTVSELSQNFECYVFTLAGFAGEPPLENGPYLEIYKSDILKFISNMQLNEVTLIGHSLGGFLSLLIGLENDPAIDKIIIVDALPFLTALSNPNAEEGFNEESAIQYENNLKNLSEEQLRQMRLLTAQSFTNDSTKWTEMVEWFLSSDSRTEAYSSHEMMGMDLRHRLAEIKIPLRIVVPFHTNPYFPDYSIDMAEQMYRLQYSAAPDAQFKIIDNAKHFVMFDQPGKFMETLKKFLNE